MFRRFRNMLRWFRNMFRCFRNILRRVRNLPFEKQPGIVLNKQTRTIMLGSAIPRQGHEEPAVQHPRRPTHVTSCDPKRPELPALAAANLHQHFHAVKRNRGNPVNVPRPQQWVWADRQGTGDQTGGARGESAMGVGATEAIVCPDHSLRGDGHGPFHGIFCDRETGTGRGHGSLSLHMEFIISGRTGDRERGDFTETMGVQGAPAHTVCDG